MKSLPTPYSSSPKLSTIVVGIDVGSPKKGFHAVALCDGRYHDKKVTKSEDEIEAWCLKLDASVIGIDAPCRWSTTGRARSAERDLATERIFCFATPSKQVAETKDFYRWMQAGTELFRIIEQHYQLFDGSTVPVKGKVCFETFPHAVACALAGKVVSAKHKRRIRHELLRQAGMDMEALTNIDIIDAALCALAAHHLVGGTFKTYGDAMTGLIVVPA